MPQLRGGELDLVLGFSYTAVGWRDGRDLDSVPLLHDPSHAVLHRGHSEAEGARPLPLERLAAETWSAGYERCRGHLMHVAQTPASSRGSPSRPTTT